MIKQIMLTMKTIKIIHMSLQGALSSNTLLSNMRSLIKTKDRLDCIYLIQVMYFLTLLYQYT